MLCICAFCVVLNSLKELCKSRNCSNWLVKCALNAICMHTLLLCKELWRMQQLKVSWHIILCRDYSISSQLHSRCLNWIFSNTERRVNTACVDIIKTFSKLLHEHQNVIFSITFTHLVYTALSVSVFPETQTHNLCAAGAMLSKKKYRNTFLNKNCLPPALHKE